MTGVVVGIAIVTVALILWFARKSGRDAEVAAESKAGERIADAEKNRATTVDDIADRVQHGGKL